MPADAAIALTYKASKKRLFVAYDSGGLFGDLLALFVLYTLR
jgi:hypothetical protein